MAFDSKGEVEGAKWFTTKGENDMDVLLLESELYEAKYVDQEEREALFKSVKWMGTGYEFLYMMEHSLSNEFKPKKDIVVLGLGTYYRVSQGVSRTIGGKYLEKAYERYGLDLNVSKHPENIVRFLEKSSEDENVGAIVFLVPPRLFSFEESAGYGKITKIEMKYFLKNPRRAGKLYLVFGAYGMVDRESFDNDKSHLFSGKDLPPIEWKTGEEYKPEISIMLAEDFKKFVESIGK